MSQPTSIPQNDTKEMEKTKEEAVVASALRAFDTIFELYPDQEALSKALKEAKGKVGTITFQIDKIHKQLAKLQDNCDATGNSLRIHFADFEQAGIDAQLDMNSWNEKRLAHQALYKTILDSLVSDRDQHPAFLELERKIDQLEAELQQVKKFSRLLEVAKVEMNAGRVKRPKDETVEEQPERKRAK